jgi:hypothetical protein
MGEMSSSQEDALMGAIGLSAEQQHLLRQQARAHSTTVAEELQQSILRGMSADVIRRIHVPVVHRYKSGWDRVTSQMAQVYRPEGRICQEDGQPFPCRTLQAIDGTSPKA